jgi:hypothetical protein
MTTANQTRRTVMLLAWGSFRSNTGVAFADCLRRAWRYIKGIGKAPVRHIRFSPSLIRSPLGRRLGSFTTADRTAAYTTACFGR